MLTHLVCFAKKTLPELERGKTSPDMKGGSQDTNPEIWEGQEKCCQLPSGKPHQCDCEGPGRAL